MTLSKKLALSAAEGSKGLPTLGCDFVIPDPIGNPGSLRCSAAFFFAIGHYFNSRPIICKRALVKKGMLRE